MYKTVLLPRGDVSRLARWFAIGVMVLVWTVTANAQVGNAETEHHGWAVVPMGDRFALVHLPPRAEVVDSNGFSGRADDGDLTLVKELREQPERLVSSGRTVLLIFEPKSTAGVDLRSVLSVSVTPSAMGGRWTSDSSGRLAVQAGIGSAEPIIDAVGFRFEQGGSVGQFAVLLGGLERSNLDLLVLDGNAWASVELPMELALATQARLVESDDGLLLIAQMEDGTGWRGWRGSVTAGAPIYPDPSVDEDETRFFDRTNPSVRWTDVGLLGDWANERDGLAWEVGASIVNSRVEPSGRWVVRSVSDGTSIEVLSRPTQGLPIATVVTGLTPNLRLILLEDKAIGGSAGGDAQEVRVDESALISKLRLVEVSASTGRVLYEGPSHYAPLISMNEYWVLGLMAAAAALGVLVFVLLPDPADGVVALPPGTALAEPFRRIAAAAADVACAMLIVTWAVEKFAESGRIEAGAAELLILVGVLVFAFVHGALGEWAMGRTVGKVLLGCRVVGTRGMGSTRITLKQALVRNLVKFAMPPVALMGLSDPNARHRGDMLAGTSVVISVENDAGGEGEAKSAEGSDNSSDDNEPQDDLDKD